MLLTYSQRFQFYMPTIIKEHVFGNIDFKQIANNPEFKEDSVREVVILPLLTKLGYEGNNIVRSKHFSIHIL